MAPQSERQSFVPFASRCERMPTNVRRRIRIILTKVTLMMAVRRRSLRPALTAMRGPAVPLRLNNTWEKWNILAHCLKRTGKGNS